MAGDWIKMRRSLLTDPRVVRIASALDADRFRTIGGLFSAWCLFDEQTPDGRLDGYSPEVFDEIVGVRGLAVAMESVGWLEIGDNWLQATAFSEHNGQTAKRRAQEAVRKMSARNADTEADKKRPREEKRREEITHTHTHKKTASRGTQPTVPEDLAVCWSRWIEYHFAKHGQAVPAIQAEAILMDLGRRGAEKAARDIEFSIRKDAKSILDSDNDFEKRQPAANYTTKKKIELQ
jgi:hypothetical protein